MDNRTTVFIADGAEEFCTSLVAALGHADGFQVVGTASDGEQAVRMIQEKRPDILVLDLMLSKKDGIGVLKSIAGMDKKPITLATTGFVTDYVASAAAAIGGSAGSGSDEDDDNEITVIIEFEFENATIVDQPFIAEIPIGEAYTTPAIKLTDILGYAPEIENEDDGWFTYDKATNSISLNISAEQATADLYYKIIYYPQPVDVTVDHYRQNVTDNNYTKYDVKEKDDKIIVTYKKVIPKDERDDSDDSYDDAKEFYEDLDFTCK